MSKGHVIVFVVVGGVVLVGGAALAMAATSAKPVVLPNLGPPPPPPPDQTLGSYIAHQGYSALESIRGSESKTRFYAETVLSGGSYPTLKAGYNAAKKLIGSIF